MEYSGRKDAEYFWASGNPDDVGLCGGKSILVIVGELDGNGDMGA
jgi:hypothetical protein